MPTLHCDRDRGDSEAPDASRIRRSAYIHSDNRHAIWVFGFGTLAQCLPAKCIARRNAHTQIPYEYRESLDGTLIEFG